VSTDLDPQDLWEELVRVGDVPAATEHALATTRAVARAAVQKELRAARARKARRRRLRYGVAAVAATLAVGLGALHVDLGGHHVAGDAAAAATLRRAATAALAQQDPVVAPGQYLRIKLVERSWGLFTEESGPNIGRDGQPAAYEEVRTRTIWIPHVIDRAWTVRDGVQVVRNVTSDPRYQDQPVPVTTVQRPSWADSASGRSYLHLYDPRWYATLPRDPQQLIARLDADFTGEGHGLDYRFSENYSEVLRSGLAPADIRAALFRGLADTPGMQVLGDVTTLDGRHGIAIGPRGAEHAMVFDKRTGLYIGERATDPSFPDVPGLDAAKTTYLTSVTTEVVDHAPVAPYDDTRPG
jgi:RNA polymerase sigma-70 factor (ECF subfamily)